MKVAVTGASGFIGRHVLQTLRSDPKFEVTAASRGRMEVSAGVRCVTLDVAASTEADYDRLGRPDVLIHLAWSGLPNYLSLHHYEEELPAQYRFLKNMVAAGLPAMVVTGTCYEYGMLSGELSEDMTAVPTNPYAYAKQALFQQLSFLKAHHPFALTWARLFYMWGEGQASGSIYPLLKAAVARGETRFAMSKGDQLRDYLPVEEVARQLAKIAEIDGGAGLVNICSGEPISIRTLVENWIAQNGWPIEPELGRYPYPAYEPLAFWGSTAKLEQTTGSSLAATDNTQFQPSLS